jgi:peptidoglycan/LPS O-acetylase OafA/YrhL
MNRNEKVLNGKFYFPNLIGLRFWMATTVIYRHIEEVKYMRHIQQDTNSISKFHSIGFYPMLMFFTLSGFLITYQLEIEKTKTGNINVLHFYKNRALRILPLFYLSIFIYWAILPHSPFADHYNAIFFKPWSSDVVTLYNIPKWIFFVLSFILLPHLANIISLINNRSWMYGVQHWSVGVEEIFYIFWPLLWRKIKSFKHFIIKCFIAYYIVLIGTFILSFIVRKLFHLDWLSHLMAGIFYFISFSNAICFFIGAIGIYVYLYRTDIIEKYINKSTASISFVIILLCMFSSFEFPILINELVCSSYMICILYLLKTGKKYVIFEHPFIVYLGKITYAVYLVHFAAILIVMYFLEKFGIQKQSLLLFNVLQYVGTFALTFSISALLYEFYEKKFLALR